MNTQADHVRGLDLIRLTPEERKRGCVPEVCERLLDTLVNLNLDIPVPEKELEYEVTCLQMIAQQQRKYQMFGMILQTPESADLTVPDEAHITDMARRQVISQVIMQRLSEEAGLTVEPEELEKEAQRIAEEQHLSIDMVRGLLGGDLDMLRKDILYRKTEQYLYAAAAHGSDTYSPRASSGS